MAHTNETIAVVNVATEAVRVSIQVPGFNWLDDTWIEQSTETVASGTTGLNHWVSKNHKRVVITGLTEGQDDNIKISNSGPDSVRLSVQALQDAGEPWTEVATETVTNGDTSAVRPVNLNSKRVVVTSLGT